MADEGFLRRWARLKADPVAAEAVDTPAPVPVKAPPVAAQAVPAQSEAGAEAESAPVLPTLEDVARLDANSDFSSFVGKGVDKDVRRLAMKKLFSDPHFNLVDKLDVYMDDYGKPSPMSAEMLAALHHTKNLFAPLAADKEDEEGAEAAAEVADDGLAASPERVVPAQAGTHTEAPEPHPVSLAPDSDLHTMDSRLRGNDDLTFNTYGADVIAAPGSIPQQPQQGNA